MEDHEFFDELYQIWSKTTGASDSYWMPEEDLLYYDGGPGTWNLYSVDDKQGREFLGSFKSDEDADFITAVHGCLPDLIRRLHTALDESDRLDYDHDSQECRIAELEMEVDELRRTLADLEGAQCENS